MRTLACLLLLASPALAQVQGLVRYEDREYDSAGFTGAQPLLPVRMAEVEILDAGSSVFYGTGVTDGTGAFSIGGVPGNTLVRARVYARRDGPGVNVVVRNNTVADAIYTVSSASVTTDAGGNAVIPALDLTVASNTGPVFNIFDCGIRSFEYQASVDADLAVSPPPMTIYWEIGTSVGTFFSDTSNAVFLLGLNSDPDQYDDDIILHELGHWIASNFSVDDSPGGTHSVIGQLDLRLSWSEGWGHYWSSAVRRFFPAQYAAPETQIDNFGTGNSVFSLEGPSFPLQTVMATNELAVAAALWDIIDTMNEGGFDLLDSLDVEIWEAVNDQIPLRTVITLEDFREALAVVAPGIMFDVTGSESVVRIMNERSIRYFTDGSEPNDAAGSATPLPLGGPPVAQRTIFPIANEDFYSVNVPIPGILVGETLNLGDGGDTLLQIFDATGTILLGSNDNRSGGDPSSRATAWITTPGTYLLRVVASGPIAENGYYDVMAARQDFPPPPETVRAGYCSASVGLAPGSRRSLVLLLVVGLLAWARRR